jgi:hypothetical protein
MHLQSLMMADTTCKKKIIILTGVFCTVGGTLVGFSDNSKILVRHLPHLSQW